MYCSSGDFLFSKILFNRSSLEPQFIEHHGCREFTFFSSLWIEVEFLLSLKNAATSWTFFCSPSYFSLAVAAYGLLPADMCFFHHYESLSNKRVLWFFWFLLVLTNIAYIFIGIAFGNLIEKYLYLRN